MTRSIKPLCAVHILFLLFFFALAEVLADSWTLPTVSTNRSNSGQYEAIVTPGTFSSDFKKSTKASLLFRRRDQKGWRQLSQFELINRLAPVNVLLPDSGRFIVTFDESHSVGENPVVIYATSGVSIARLSLKDLGLEGNPHIVRSVSSYWWNEEAIYLFGPRASSTNKAWEKLLEDSLFIRLYWGDIIAIDLASGRIRSEPWWNSLPPDQRAALKSATDKFLAAEWNQRVERYCVRANFEPLPTSDGNKGLLLAAQLHRTEFLPLFREVARTPVCRGYAAPALDFGPERNVAHLAESVVQQLERGQ